MGVRGWGLLGGKGGMGIGREGMGWDRIGKNSERNDMYGWIGRSIEVDSRVCYIPSSGPEDHKLQPILFETGRESEYRDLGFPDSGSQSLGWDLLIGSPLPSSKPHPSRQ